MILLQLGFRIRSSGAAVKELGFADKQVTKRWVNNIAEYSYLTFIILVRARPRFRHMRSL